MNTSRQGSAGRRPFGWSALFAAFVWLALLQGRPACAAATLCFEAELANEMAYPFEIGEFEGASNGVAAHIDEGAGSECAFERGRAGFATYHISLPEDGPYAAWLRVWWNSLCSNSVYLVIGNSPPLTVEGRVLRQWHWVPAGRWKMKAGDTSLSVLDREDGVRVDQILLSTANRPPPDEPQKANVIPGGWGREPKEPRMFLASTPEGFLDALPSASRISHGRLDMVPLPQALPIVLRSRKPTPIMVWLRNNSTTEASGTIELDTQAPVKMTPGREAAFGFSEADLLKRISLEIAPTPETPRGMFQMRVRVRHASGRVEEQPVLLMRPFQWLVTNAIPWNPDANIRAPTALEENIPQGFPGPAQGFSWRLASEDAFSRFGLLDMRRAVRDTVNALAYAYTRVESPNEAEYLLDVRHDDMIRVWLNGQAVFTNPRTAPSDMSRQLIKVKLRTGANDLLVKLSQRDRYWEFSLHVLTLDGKPAPVYGMDVASLLETR